MADVDWSYVYKSPVCTVTCGHKYILARSETNGIIYLQGESDKFKPAFGLIGEGTINSMCEITADDKKLHVFAAGMENSTIPIWELESFEKGDTVTEHEATKVLAGHKDSVTCIDSIGNKVCSSSKDATVKVWQPVKKNKALYTIQAAVSKDELTCCSWVGDTIFSGGNSGCIGLYDASNGKTKHKHQAPGAVKSLDVYYTSVAAGLDNGKTMVFDTRSKGVLFENNNSYNGIMRSVKWRDRSKFLAAGGGSEAVVWDTRKPKMPLITTNVAADGIQSITWGADERLLIGDRKKLICTRGYAQLTKKEKNSKKRLRQSAGE